MLYLLFPLYYASAVKLSNDENSQLTSGKNYYIMLVLSKDICGCGGIGIRARLRGVFSNEYEFKSRQPHENGFIER